MSDTKPKLTDAERLLLMLLNWEKPERKGVMLPYTQMTCGPAAAAIRAHLAVGTSLGSGELEAAGLAQMVDKYATSMYGRIVGVPDFVIKQHFSEFAAEIAALVTPVDHPEVVGVKIKPLEWNEDGWLDGRAVKWLAVSFGYSWIIRNDDHAFLCCGCRYASLDRAKAAAQADFETRIRSAIQPSDEAGVAWGDSGPIPGQSFGDEFDAQPQPVAPLRLHFDRETLKRQIEADGEEGEIGAGYEMFPSPVLAAGVAVMDAMVERALVAVNNIDPFSRDELGMSPQQFRRHRMRAALVAAVAHPATEHALSKDTSRFNTLSSVDDETIRQTEVKS
ncbi:hypothetical protein NKJ88_05895 [Mesorhizobium sp. M0016]|uniref:hypothetical protein n=1 Tax=Mesorhizobium sp. M0016 TaxID=2956843 RepID=UPI00333885E6